eukprot:gene14498-17112_t
MGSDNITLGDIDICYLFNRYIEQLEYEKTKVKLWTPLLERQKSRDEMSFQHPEQQQQQQQHIASVLQQQIQDSLDSDSDLDDEPKEADYDDFFNSDPDDLQIGAPHHTQPSAHSPSSAHDFELRGSIEEIEQNQHNGGASHPALPSDTQGYNILRTPLLELKGHTGPVAAATWISSSVIVSASWDNTIRWWNTDNGRTIAQANSICMDKVHRITNITAIPNCNNNNAISTSTDGVIRIWDSRTTTGVSGPIDSIHGHQEGVNTAVYTQDANHIVSGGDDRTVKAISITEYTGYYCHSTG